MQKTQLAVLMSVVGLAWLLSSCATTSPTSAAAGTPHIRALRCLRQGCGDDGFGGIFGTDKPASFYPKDEALPAEMRYYGGTPPEIIKMRTAFSGANIQLIDGIVAEAAQINPHIHFIGGGFHLVAAENLVIEKIAATGKRSRRVGIRDS